MKDGLERFDLTASEGRISYEHLHRYVLCRDRAHGLRVLDIACGTGYGSFLLSEVAAEVTGLDIDPEAVATAARRYQRSNLRYLEGDAYDLPFANGSFDLVTANEMIEHIEDHDAFLSEVKRVLVPSGRLLVSTPNKEVYNRYKAPNPFHVSELELDEFRELLERRFANVDLTGLRMALVSAAFDLGDKGRPSNIAASKTFVRVSSKSKAKPVINNQELALDEPEYVLAVCSDAEIERLPLQSSIYVSQTDDLWLQHEQIMAWASQLHEEDEKLRRDLRDTRAELETRAQPSAETILIKNGVEVTSKLLGNLTGREVPQDLVSTTQAIFEINERLLRQSLQLERLANAEAQSSALQSELGSARQEQDRLEASLSAISAEKDEMAKSLGQAIDEAERAKQEFIDEQAEADRKAADLQAQATSLASELDAAHRASRRLEDEKRGLLETLQALKTAVEQERQQRKKLETPSVDRAARPQQTTSAKLESVAAQRRNRLSTLQRQVQSELASAYRAAESAAAPPGTQAKFGAISKFLGRKRSFGALVDLARVRQHAGEKKLPLEQYLRDPSYFEIDPNPLFSARDYLRQNEDVQVAGVSPLVHYAEHGWREGRSPHRFFANDWYLKHNPDVLAAGLNPLRHYLEHGWKEGRRPNPVFDPHAYLERFPDVREAGLEPLTHYVEYGIEEGREIPCQGLDSDWRELAGATEGGSLLDFLLAGPALAKPAAALDISYSEAWPPPPLSEFWLPQRMRDYLVESHREGEVALYQYLYSVMAAYNDDPAGFASSETCRALIGQMARKSQARAAQSTSPPAASVIVPVYNNLLDTLLCLAALLEHECLTTFEIVVADDASPEVTFEQLRDVGGVVRHVRQDRNLGFLANCNAAAEVARGNFVVLLNNDTLVLPGWLDHLLAPFAMHKDVGLVGSKLLNWDGTLQEAGGIFWKDGSAWNFGRGSNPLAPEFNYLKDVDYCSGASIAVPTAVWRKMGGFDPLYEPAYCEDSDLAFRLRAEGYRTLYQPHSEVIHHEGRSHGRDVNSGVKAFQVANQQHFVDRWSDILNNEHFPNAQEVLKARDRSRGKRHILVIDHYIPKWDHDAGSRTIFQYIELFIELGFQVTFWPDNLYLDPVYGPALQELGVEIVYGPDYRQGFESFIKDRSRLYDAVFLSRPHVAINYLPEIRTHTNAKTLFYGHDLHFRRLEAAKEIGEPVDEASISAVKEQELQVCRLADVIFYPDPAEVDIVRPFLRDDQVALANPVFVYSAEEISKAREALPRLVVDHGKRLLFIGGFNHSPNREGIIWFVREVLPLVQARIPDVHLDIAGSNPPREVLDLEGPSVSVLGRVSDERLEELYRDAAVAVAPLRFGAGVKGKVIEALAKGVPCATTPTGAQGIEGDAEMLFVGEDPTSLSEAVIEALTDRDLALGRATAGLNFIEASYGRRSLSDLFRKLI